jgi:predicted RNA methylase
MGRFASTVAYYESARPPYGAGFFAEVARELGLDGSQRLLDIGAGPGILAIAITVTRPDYAITRDYGLR